MDTTKQQRDKMLTANLYTRPSVAGDVFILDENNNTVVIVPKANAHLAELFAAAPRLFLACLCALNAPTVPAPENIGKKLMRWAIGRITGRIPETVARELAEAHTTPAPYAFALHGQPIDAPHRVMTRAEADELNWRLRRDGDGVSWIEVKTEVKP
jgi:hypothetical protein